ncbi:ABC transporter ATP-binding protein [Lentilactobacillus laojiaonis]|uniref:ABC transporter ATP-binding protein n=1 Tax=Lentilactobacillus laojiaonis TaxID=2883998 RepID=UPI001D0BD2D1|nr:ABC transporter ATP-binding protein [Lentilactobacillus laojiaonis]UDM32688.1 ABC transporter ATP-binding protein [Lentilactobacillus laojiaonis]
MIEFSHINKKYLNQLALNDLNLTIPTGDLFVLVGPSGSGKTTTLKMINRLIEPTSGTIKLDNQDVTEINVQKLRLNMGYILQNIALFPNLNLQDNIAIQLEAKHVPRSKRVKQARKLLDLVGLPANEYAMRYPRELSGGEQQRVGIVRGISTNPKIILMDEPFSALDPISRKQLQNLVLELHQKLNVTIVFVTHDMQEALRLGTHIAVMKDGHIQQIGTPNEITDSPANNFVKEFFDSVNIDTNITLSDFILDGYDQLPQDNGNYLELPMEATINQLSQGLKGHTDGVKVKTSEGTYRVITTNDLLSFISERGV